MSATLLAADPFTDIIAQLTDALAAHRRGRYQAAEAGYRAVLAEEPSNPTALRLLGMLYLATNRATAAVIVLDTAVEAHPEDADSRVALGDACAAIGDTAAAIGHYRAVLADLPGHHAARVNLANALRSAGDHSGAIAECRLALATAPRLIEAHITLGAALLSAGRIVEAIGAFRTAVGIDGTSGLARCGYAMALLRDRRAVDALDAALRAIEAAPISAEAWFIRGAAERALKKYPAALISLDHATRCDPRHAKARLALGNTRADLDDLAGAEVDIRAAIAADPGLPEAHASLGFVLTALGRAGDAIAACDVAIALRPDFARAYWNRSTAHLLLGDLPSGFADYEERRRDPQFAADFGAMTGPEWNGEPLEGRTLLVMAEQGLGDTIQFARFLPHIAGGRVILACAAPLVPLLRPLGETVPRDMPLPAHDLFVFQMSLPRILGTTLATIPSAGGYLSADAARGARWAVAAGRRRIGIAWAGNPDHSNDARRSIPTAALAPFATQDADWINLQRGARGAELAIMHRMPAPPTRIADFADTAALIATLDLVITVDTAVAHVAGALGKPVWVLLPHAPDWRWMLERADSPWYASARLFRQDSPGDWDGVIARAVAALR